MLAVDYDSPMKSATESQALVVDITLRRRPPSGREALAPGRYAAVKGDGGSVDGVWLCGTGA